MWQMEKDSGLEILMQCLRMNLRRSKMHCWSLVPTRYLKHYNLTTTSQHSTNTKSHAGKMSTSSSTGSNKHVHVWCALLRLSYEKQSRLYWWKYEREHRTLKISWHDFVKLENSLKCLKIFNNCCNILLYLTVVVFRFIVYEPNYKLNFIRSFFYILSLHVVSFGM